MKFERGDIIKVSLNPTIGKELKGEFRPCLVLSPSSFNALGLVYVAPITQGGNFDRFNGFAVTLMGAGTETQGVVLASGVRSMDLNTRRAMKVEKAPAEIVEEVLAKLLPIFE